MSITIERAQEISAEFWRHYPPTRQVDIRIRETQEILYGQEASVDKAGIIYGGYLPARGPLHRGRCDFAVTSIRDENEFKQTIQHELLGHFGINTFTAEQKRDILEAIIAAKEQPGISIIWDRVNKHYSELTMMAQAEEVYAFSCEAINSKLPIDVTKGHQAINDIFIDRQRVMTLTDLKNITEMVSQEIHLNLRKQINFIPTEDSNIKQEQNTQENKNKIVIINMTKPLIKLPLIIEATQEKSKTDDVAHRILNLISGLWDKTVHPEKKNTPKI
jgi:putative DNA primase/helicase